MQDDKPATQTTLSDDELARGDPDLCEHGWSWLHPQPCPECEDVYERLNSDDPIVRAMLAERERCELLVLRSRDRAARGTWAWRELDDLASQIRSAGYARSLPKRWRRRVQDDKPSTQTTEATNGGEDGLRVGTEYHADTELGELVRWFVDYAERPIDPELIRRAEQKDLPAATLLSLGHGSALTAVLGKVKEILRARQ